MDDKEHSRADPSKSTNTPQSSSRVKKNDSRYRKAAARRNRIEKAKEDNSSWIDDPPENGYIRHPDAKWLMHPSFFDNDHPLCPYSSPCIHERDCRSTRVLMATLSYIRNEKYTTYRDLELIWGVSRSTIQRKRKKIEGTKSKDRSFLLYEYRSKGPSADKSKR